MVYYREEWFGKQLYFYPLWSKQDKSIVEVWHVEQLISLKFNGEKLQILEACKVLKEYEARSGKMENRNAESNSIKPVNYPINSASNTLNVEDSKKFYYDNEAKYKLACVKYYIFGNKISNFSGCWFYKLFTNNIDGVGTKYIQIHKNLLGDNTKFLPEKEKMLIHGGKDYEDKGGIDLSTGADEFFTDLDKFVNETYKDKLYTVSNKVPIKLVVSYKCECIFSLTMEPVNSKSNSTYSDYAWDRTEGLIQTMFGSSRNEGKRKHAGIDLYTGETTSGEVVAIADGVVVDTRLFYNETDQISIYHEINGKPYIVRYGELVPKSIIHKKGDLVKQGDKLGETGVLIKKNGSIMNLNFYSRAKGSFSNPMRMLHFEVFNMEIDGVSIEDLKRVNTDKYILTNFHKDMSKPKYNRRKDIINPLEILKQGYEASKKSGLIKS